MKLTSLADLKPTTHFHERPRHVQAAISIAFAGVVSQAENLGLSAIEGRTAGELYTAIANYFDACARQS